MMINNKFKKHIALYFLSFSLVVLPRVATAAFEVVALGVYGGISSDNLTSYLIKSDEQKLYLALDAGTTVSGIEKAIQKNSFPELAQQDTNENNDVGFVLRDLINSYWISHGHLDHMSGLIIASPDDVKKTVYGSKETLQYMTDNIFNWGAWPNMTNSGIEPRLGKLIFMPEPMNVPFSIGETGLTGVAYPLNHGGYPSSMLLVSDKNDSFAFFGDTGSDFVQKSNELNQIWQVLAKKVRGNSLKGMIIETSFTSETPDKSLYGHLTPHWLLKELKVLEKLSGGAGSLKGLNIMIGHLKPSLNKNQDAAAEIKSQIINGNDMGINFIFPVQGERYNF